MAKVDFSKATIFLNHDYNPKYDFGSLIHEIVEAIRKQYTLNMNHTTLTTLSEALASCLIELMYGKGGKRGKK
jgi:hypothetical protein